MAAQIVSLGSFEAFLLALCFAGLIQIVLGIAQAGFAKDFFPTSVIKGLLAAIGVILILKQIPHLLGHDADPEGDMAFRQPDSQNTLSELIEMFDHVHLGALTIGILYSRFHNCGRCIIGNVVESGSGRQTRSTAANFATEP